MNSVRPRVVGTIPRADDDMSVGDLFAWQMLALPGIPVVSDGELDRPNWVVAFMKQLLRHPDLELRSTGNWTSYTDWPSYGVKRGHRLTSASLQLDYTNRVPDTLDELKRVSAELRVDQPSLQVGIPDPMNLAFGTFGAPAFLRHYSVFRDLVVREITEVYDTVGDQVVFQLEIPAQMAGTIRAGALGGPAASWFAKRLADLVADCPREARFGVHLCYGDLGHQPIVKPQSLRPAVTLANAIAAQWPHSRPPEFMHIPFSAGSHTLPLARGFYAELGRLQLPKATRVVAGMIEESQFLGQLEIILGWVMEHLGEEVDVAAYCGFGRRTWGQTQQWAEKVQELLALQPTHG